MTATQTYYCIEEWLGEEDPLYSPAGIWGAVNVAPPDRYAQYSIYNLEDAGVLMDSFRAAGRVVRLKRITEEVVADWPGKRSNP
jgi:hypothetical protein